MPSDIKKLFLILFISLSVLTFSPKTKTAIAATEYGLLAPLPINNGVSGGDSASTTPEQYIRGIVNLAVAAAGVIAVLKLVAAGFKYIAVESFSGKDTAKKDIQNALIGLFLAIGAFTILQTISSQFVNLTITPEVVGTSTGLVNGGVNVSGTTSPTCIDCVNVTKADFPQKDPGAGCAGTEPCRVRADGATKLKALAAALSGKVQWQVSEMFPPTVPHISACHDDGSCVDVVLNDANVDSNLIIFLTEIQKQFSTNYEYESCTRLGVLQNDAALAAFKDRFKCEKTTINENAHINF